MSPIRFDGRVAIVTGAGNGIGRTYALFLAARGAKVVVNDLGGSFDGKGSGTKAADQVVEEIRRMGGVATANYDSVTNGEKVVETAIRTYGKIDIVINNAGILRDGSFAKMSDENWDIVHAVHSQGAYKITRAAWPHMRKNKYGRIVMITSSAGLFGNFGQTNYSSAKMSVVGMANTLSKEGAKSNIKVNVIAPFAGSRMTETVMTPEMVAGLKPDYIAPFVAYLCSEKCPSNGEIFETGGGWVGQVKYQRSMGVGFDLNKTLDLETIDASWDQVRDFSPGNTDYPKVAGDAFKMIFENLKKVEPSSKL
jgi:NAD(P)-dependent dehydrogenase (short-subunit alcohol dehydrogenase family)|eukprot:Stramenopile-MAST_4_protein_1099